MTKTLYKTEFSPPENIAHSQTIFLEQAIKHLSKDQDVARIIELIGSCRLVQLTPSKHPEIRAQKLFSYLVKTVVGQQLHTKAAQKIQEKLESFLGEMTPPNILSKDSDSMRKIGLSFTKIKAISGITEAFLNDPFFKQEVIVGSIDEWEKRLLNLYGIGPWSKNIILLEALHLPDIMPHHDFGLRKAWQSLKKLNDIPTPEYLLEESQIFSPFRSVLSWYLWESLSLERYS